MVKKFWTVVEWGILIFVILFVANMVWNFSSEVTDERVADEYVVKCVDVNSVPDFEYNACYDAYSEMIFLKVKRVEDKYDINFLEVFFVDFATRSNELREVPAVGKSMAYKFSAKKNPQNIAVKLDVVKDFPEPICESFAGVFVDYCPVSISGGSVDLSASPIGGVGSEDIVDVRDFPIVDSDVFTLDLVDAKKIWEFSCDSNWQCGAWEVCENGIQRRDCEDISGCAIPSDSPKSVRGCDGNCIEDWECEWGACINGVSVPSCNDLNSCGTRYDAIEELNCEKVSNCVPNIDCSEWSECEVDYDFFNLIGSGVANLRGSKFRICTDKKKCVLPQKEVTVCSVSVDIYTDRFERCGNEYIGVYNTLDDGLLAVVEEGTTNDPYLNIYFDDQEDMECDYCFDGIMNGDESDVDCGGNCRECVEEVPYERGFWDWLRRVF